MIGLSLDHEKCTGCGLCAIACSTRFDLRGFNPRMSAIRVHVVGVMDADVPMVCMQCEDAPCAAACPEEAFYRAEGTGALAIDQERCLNCGECITACPYGAIYEHPRAATPIKCDLCEGKPLCVGYCVPGAITLATEATWAKERRDAYYGLLSKAGGVKR